MFYILLITNTNRYQLVIEQVTNFTSRFPDFTWYCEQNLCPQIQNSSRTMQLCRLFFTNFNCAVVLSLRCTQKFLDHMTEIERIRTNALSKKLYIYEIIKFILLCQLVVLAGWQESKTLIKWGVTWNGGIGYFDIDRKELHKNRL